MKKIIPVALLLLLLLQSTAGADLFQYLAKEDPSYKWEKVDEQALPDGATKIGLKLTSQTWQGLLLTHRIYLIKPKVISDPTAVFLIITGSGGGKEELVIGSAIARDIGAPIAILHDVPYQPLFGKLKEDTLIAYTFIKALETGDEEWPLLFSMTKTAVRAMDAIQEFFREELDTKVDGFVVAGASKRGWTTWFTGIADKRVKGIVPMVYDNLDLVRQMEHQLEAWGEYSQQIGDYTRLNIPQRLKNGNDKDTRKLATIVDPYTYRDRVTIPKLIVIGTNDRYWPLDALNIYYDDLVGDKYILYIPNKGHRVTDMKRLIGDAVGFFLRVEGVLDFPALSWDFEEKETGLELLMRSDPKPASVSVWTAESATRDFRDAVWQTWKTTLEDSTYRYTLKRPEQGYAAIFGELVYKSGGKNFFLSTNVRILGAK